MTASTVKQKSTPCLHLQENLILLLISNTRSLNSDSLPHRIDCPKSFPVLIFYFGISPVGQGWKSLSVAIVFQVFSTIQGKTAARNFCNFSSEALQSQ